MTEKRIHISVERQAGRRHELSVNDLSYGGFMHRQNAINLARFGAGLLLDLQQAGILSKDYSITLDTEDKPHDAVPGQSTHPLPPNSTQ